MKIAMLGGHASGKTSYLGALWATVRSASPGEPATLRGGHLPASSTYLDECEHALLAGERVERTRRDHGERIDLDLLIDGAPLAVTHLDIAGETYETALEQRVAAPSLLAELAETDAVMLFINPGRLKMPQSIADARRLMAAVDDTINDAPEHTGEPRSNDIDLEEVWKQAPTAVHLVELLQLVIDTRTKTDRLTVALIVSAWDTLDQGPEWGDRVAPEPWIARNLPFLYQYVSANVRHMDWRAFGVSAQGCDFDDRAAVDALVERPYSERTVVTTEGRWTRDIAEPLRWFVRETAARL